MFVYERDNSLNLTFTGNTPVENPDVVIKGYEDGATLTVNGTVFGKGSKEFEGKAKTLVYQRDKKLMITFRGVAGMTDPEVTIDELNDDNYAVVVDGEVTTLAIKEGKVEITTEVDTENNKSEDPVVEPEIPAEAPNTEIDLPESVDGEGDSDATVEDI